MGCSTLGQGAIVPQTSALPPKCDMKHCMTNSKHWHIGAKRSVLWPSKYAKMGFQPPPDSAGDITMLPQSPLVGWYLIPHSTQRTSIWWGQCPQIFLSRTAPVYLFNQWYIITWNRSWALVCCVQCGSVLWVCYQLVFLEITQQVILLWILQNKPLTNWPFKHAHTGWVKIAMLNKVRFSNFGFKIWIRIRFAYVRYSNLRLLLLKMTPRCLCYWQVDNF